MRRPVAKFAALAVIVYVAGLVALFPASLALHWFAPDVPGFSLGPAEGTVWHGEVSGVRYREWNLGSADWTVEPTSLFTLAVAGDVRLDRPGQGPASARLRVDASGDIRVEALRGAVTLAELSRARLLPNVASGELILNLQRLELRDGKPVAADGTAALTGLRSALLPGVALGHYEGTVETTDEGIRASFRDVEAPLRVVGQGTLNAEGRYTVSGSITPTEETPQPVQQGLALLGQPNASGRYEFEFSGRL